MNKKWSLLLVCIIFGTGIWIGSSVMTSNADGLIPDNQPGSVDDPLVTKSYVDQQLQQILKGELPQLPQQPINGGNSGQGSVGQAANPSTELIVVKLEAGQMLYAGEGTEFIVRTGKATAYSSDSNGIPDVTAGKDIANGTTIEHNHQLIFPREGRGIQANPDQKGTVFVMVRGSYLQADADGKRISP